MLWLLVIRNGAAGLALSPWLWREKDRFPWKQAWPASLCYALFMMAFAMSTRWVGAAAAVAGQYTAPLFVYMYLAARKKLMVRFSNAFPMGLIAAGCLIGLCAGGALSVLAVCCGVLFPLYTAGLRRCQDLSAMSVMALGNLLCAILSLPAALCTEALDVYKRQGLYSGASADHGRGRHCGAEAASVLGYLPSCLLYTSRCV